MKRTILVLPDSHAKPGVSQRRYKVLGKFISQLRPDIVLDLGDFGDFPSLSIYDGARSMGGSGGNLAFEGRRYKNDIAAVIEAQELINQGLKGLAKKPKLIGLHGNHEARVARAVSHTPELEGVLSLDDMQRAEFGWEMFPFLERTKVQGFIVSHYFVSGLMGKSAATGERPALNLLKKTHQSCIQGHSHLWDTAQHTRGDGSKMQCFVAGCYVEPTFRESYAGPAFDMWGNGLTILRGAENGYAHDGFEFISTLKILKEFGG